MLPIEVWEIVIESLWYHPQTLISCTLTCRAWHPKSRHCLQSLRQARLHCVKDLNALVDEVVHSPDRARCLRELRIVVDTKDTSSTPTWVSKVTLTLPSKLPRLTALELSGIQSVAFDPLGVQVVSAFKTITSLTFEGCSFPTFSQFGRILLSLPSLKHLGVGDLEWAEYRTLPWILGPKRAKILRLRTLAIWTTRSTTWLGEFIWWLLTTASRNTIQDLQLRLRVSGDYSGLRDLLRAVSHNLHRFFLLGTPDACPSLSSQGQSCTCRATVIGRVHDFFTVGMLTLSKMSQLVYLEFMIPVVDLEFYGRVIATLSPHTKSLQVVILLDSESDLDHPAWSSFDTLAQPSTYHPDLVIRVFALVFHGGSTNQPDWKVPQMAVLERLPVLRAKGLLYDADIGACPIFL